MDIITFSSQLESRMKEELEELSPILDDVTKISKALDVIRDRIGELKEYTRAYQFKDQAEEIQFFKEVNPVFLSQFFYYKKLLSLRLVTAFKNNKDRLRKQNQVLHRMSRFVRKEIEFYTYCMSNNSNLDRYYFTRGNSLMNKLGADERCSTGYDAKLGKILGYELLRKELLENQKTFGNQCELRWTGSKASLIELIYALQVTEVFNDGKTDIKLIASFFEQAFNVNLGNYYRIFQDIRLRKKNQAVFLDRLKEKFSQRIQELEL